MRRYISLLFIVFVPPLLMPSLAAADTDLARYKHLYVDVSAPDIQFQRVQPYLLGVVVSHLRSTNQFESVQPWHEGLNSGLKLSLDVVVKEKFAWVSGFKDKALGTVSLTDIETNTILNESTIGGAGKRNLLWTIASSRPEGAMDELASNTAAWMGLTSSGFGTPAHWQVLPTPERVALACSGFEGDRKGKGMNHKYSGKQNSKKMCGYIEEALEGAGIEVSADAATKLGFDYLEHGQPKAGSNVTEYVVVGRWTLTDGQTVLLQDVLTSRAHNQGFLGTIKRMKKTAEESLRAQADKAVLALGWADST